MRDNVTYANKWIVKKRRPNSILNLIGYHLLMYLEPVLNSVLPVIRSTERNVLKIEAMKLILIIFPPETRTLEPSWKIVIFINNRHGILLSNTLGFFQENIFSWFLCNSFEKPH